MARLITCPGCNEQRYHEALGFCRPCYWRQWRQENRERHNELNRRWARANRDKARAIDRRWRENNPGRHMKHHRYRARKKNALATLTEGQMQELLMIGRATHPGEELHLDHIVPLNKGGGTTRANIHAIPARLNMSKGDMLPEEAYDQLLLEAMV